MDGAGTVKSSSASTTLDGPTGAVSQLIESLARDLSEVESKHGRDHPDAISGRDELARVCRYARRFDEALSLYFQTLVVLSLIHI